jgi:hypothetical protein
MKYVHRILAVLLLAAGCAYGQMIVISAPTKDPDVRPDQRTANIVHYEKMRSSARASIRVLAIALQNTDGSSKARLNEAIDHEDDIVDWANWCILALRDRTDDAKTCVFQPEPR